MTDMFFSAYLYLREVQSNFQCLYNTQWAGSHVPPALYSLLGPKDEKAVIEGQSRITVGQFKLIFLFPSDKANIFEIISCILWIQEYL